MNSRALISRENWSRIERLLAGKCSDDDVRALEESLQGDTAAQKMLLDYCQLHIDLSIDVRAETASQHLLDQVEQSTPPATPALGFIAECFHRGADLLSRPMLFVPVAVTTVLVGALAAWVWFNGRSANGPLASGPEATTDVRRADLSDVASATTSTYVARIVKASADCTWGELAALGEFLLRVRAGDRIDLAAGLVELEFHSGARIILHGPTVFTPTGPAAGHLESGRLTGKVDNGNFRLLTPAAEVIDLGTEFGVVADATMGSDVVVFDGRVQVVSRSERAGAGKVLDMTEGMAARFRFDGTTEYGLQTDAAQFKRSVASSGALTNENEVCLIDVLAGGDGFGTHLAGAIDPLTGRKEYGEGRQQPRIGPRPTDRAFHPCAWHPMIDGVFIPPPEGRQVQIDSVGHKVDLPASCGHTWTCIWSRSKQSVMEPDNNSDNDFWGGGTLRGIVERLGQVRNGLIGIHANVGVTIDLQAVRLMHHREPNEFRGAVVNLENSGIQDATDSQRTADLRIFVDGELRYSRLAFRREDGDAQFVVPLGPDDRFLTVVSGDDGNYDWDQVLLVDPVIVLPDPSQIITKANSQ